MCASLCVSITLFYGPTMNRYQLKLKREVQEEGRDDECVKRKIGSPRTSKMCAHRPIHAAEAGKLFCDKGVEGEEPATLNEAVERIGKKGGRSKMKKKVEERTFLKIGCRRYTLLQLEKCQRAGARSEPDG